MELSQCPYLAVRLEPRYSGFLVMRELARQGSYAGHGLQATSLCDDKKRKPTPLIGWLPSLRRPQAVVRCFQQLHSCQEGLHDFLKRALASGQNKRLVRPGVEASTETRSQDTQLRHLLRL